MPKQEKLTNFALYYKDNPMKNDKEMKTITIRQGSGDDALEMTVQVTQEEFEKMEELRSKNPQKWPEYSLELVKEAKDALAKPSSSKKRLETKTKSKKRSWLWIVLSIIIIVASIAIWFFTRNTSIIQGNDLAFRNLQGPVKTIYTLEFDAVNAYGEGIILDKPRLDDLTIRCFDSQGNQTIRKNFNISYCDLRQVDQHNSQGQLIETRYYYKGKCSGSFNYEYNLKGEKTKCISAGNLGIDFLDQSTIYSYSYQHDKKGKIVVEEDYTDGHLSTVINTEYDELGRIKKTYSESPIYGYDQTEYQYIEDGYIKQRQFDGYNYKEYSLEKWMFDKKACRNDKYVYEENGKLNGKISYYYDKDSIFYMEEYWDADGKLQGTYNHYYVSTLNDSVFFTTMHDDSNVSSTIEFTRPVINGYEKKRFDIKSEPTSSMTGVFDNPLHQVVRTDDGSSLSIEYDRKKNRKSSNCIFSDGETIRTKYSYRGREKKWKLIETDYYGDGKKKTTTNTFSKYYLLNSIESDGLNKHWEYNENGEEILYRESNADITISEIRYSNYVYDKYGNWIRRANYNVLTDTYTVTERCIKYY